MKPGLCAACFFVSWLIVHSVFAEPDEMLEWGYYNVPASEGPDNWKVNFPHCGGQQQSPIHIYSDQVQVKSELGDIKFTGYDDLLVNYNFTMTNNGHSVVFAVDTYEQNLLPIHIEDGGLGDKYHLDQFHFHWGSGNDNGSEHWVDDVHYAAELHLVHIHNNFTFLAEALETPQAVAVLGVIIEVDGDDNPDFEDIISHIPNVAYKDYTPYVLKPFPLRQLLPKKDANKFYRYEGSLTNPPCSEVVVWSVFERTVKVSQKQIDVLRNELHHTVKAKAESTQDYKLVDNHRLPQPLNERAVYVNTERARDGDISGGTASRDLLPLTMLIAIALCLYENTR